MKVIRLITAAATEDSFARCMSLIAPRLRTEAGMGATPIAWRKSPDARASKPGWDLPVVFMPPTVGPQTRGTVEWRAASVTHLVSVKNSMPY
jgi:hypothetical protein